MVGNTKQGLAIVAVMGVIATISVGSGIKPKRRSVCPYALAVSQPRTGSANVVAYSA